MLSFAVPWIGSPELSFIWCLCSDIHETVISHFWKKKKVNLSSMGSFGGQTKWMGAWGEERWVNRFSNGVLICGCNLQRAAPGCASWDDESWGDSVAVIISGIIDQEATPSELERDDWFCGSIPGKTGRPSGHSQGRDSKVPMWMK